MLASKDLALLNKHRESALKVCLYTIRKNLEKRGMFSLDL